MALSIPYGAVYLFGLNHGDCYICSATCINRNIVYFSIVISLIKLEIEVSYFLILPFPPTIKLTATIELKY